jgi:hypothetical protein
MVIYWWRYRQAEKRGEVHGSRKASSASEPTNMDGQVVNSELSATQESQAQRVSPIKFKLFIYALLTAYIAVLVRCVYRYVNVVPLALDNADSISIPEMALGWGSALMQNETLFLILDGA